VAGSAEEGDLHPEEEVVVAVSRAAADPSAAAARQEAGSPTLSVELCLQHCQIVIERERNRPLEICYRRDE